MLKTVDDALNQVDALRSNTGAAQNRFASVISNTDSTVNNLSESRSRITDADFASEVSNMSRANILQSAGTTVLAQANQFRRTYCLCCAKFYPAAINGPAVYANASPSPAGRFYGAA